jgi:signal transduction histidine kinase/DNA-binding response OmpR family regulator/HPt (histidine-containing phosphotransfer) domain-containing protein
MTPPLLVILLVSLAAIFVIAGYELQRRQAERLLRRIAELEREVQGQAAALHHARRSAEAAEAAKGEFLATISHELRTPLNAILGTAGMLLESHLDPHPRESVRTIQGASRALLAVINDLLDYASLEEGGVRIHRVAFDLSGILEETLDLLSIQAEEKGIDLVLRLEPSLQDRFLGDPDRIRQVVLNLLGNALKFTERGHVLVSVESERAAGESLGIRITLEDTGIGITADKQARLFERFSQADSGIARRYGGTGLGLAISRKLVELMGGRIGLESRLGVGSWFWFTLELPVEPVPEPPVPPSWPELRVLVVTPRDVAGTALVEILGSWGAHGTLVPSLEACESALRAACAEGRPVQAMLLDADLPEDPAWVSRLALEVPAILMLVPMHSRQEVGDWRSLGAKGVLRRPIYGWALQAALEPVREALREGRPVPWTGGEEEPADPEAPRPLEGRWVLLAEDNELNQKVAREMLASMGAEVVLAGDGHEAIARCRECRFDIVLMDIQMPGLDGYGATRAIRAQEQGRRTPILALTAHAMEGEEARAREAGMDGLLTKPIEKPTLQRALAPLMKGGMVHLSPAVDGAALGQLGADGRNVAVLFLTHASGCLQKLHQGLADREVEPLVQGAHALNGMSAYVHARTLRALCGELEACAAGGRFREAEALVARVQTEQERVAEALRLRFEL